MKSRTDLAIALFNLQFKKRKCCAIDLKRVASLWKRCATAAKLMRRELRNDRSDGDVARDPGARAGRHARTDVSAAEHRGPGLPLRPRSVRERGRPLARRGVVQSGRPRPAALLSIAVRAENGTSTCFPASFLN